MQERYIIVYTNRFFSKVLDYIEAVEREYTDYDIEYSYSIFYRVIFDDFKVEIYV